MYNPYNAQQYLQVYGVPGSVNLATYPYNIGQYVPYNHVYTTSHRYPLPGHQTVQLGGPSVTSITTSFPTLQPLYATGRVLFLSISLFLLCILKFTQYLDQVRPVYIRFIDNYFIGTG